MLLITIWGKKECIISKLIIIHIFDFFISCRCYRIVSISTWNMIEWKSSLLKLTFVERVRCISQTKQKSTWLLWKYSWKPLLSHLPFTSLRPYFMLCRISLKKQPVVKILRHMSRSHLYKTVTFSTRSIL